MDLNKAYILNPDYHFKNDKDRIVLFSKKQLKYDSNEDWIGFIHPVQAMILSLFTDDKPLKEHCDEIARHFKMNADDSLKMIEPYIENENPVYTVWEKQEIQFPKNVLIPLNESEKNEISYDFELSDITCENVDITPDRMHSAPQSFILMMTTKCVTSCKYCYADRRTPHKELSTEQILAIIDEAADLKMSYIDVIGGEVFCKKDWDIIIKRLVDKGLSPSFISTKVPLTRDMVKKLKDTGYDNMIQISLDSLDDDILKNMIGSRRGYAEAIKECIELLQEYGFKLEFDTILTKLNSNKESIDKLFNYIKNVKRLRYWEVRVPEVSLYTPKTFDEIMADKATIEKTCDYVRKEIIPKAGFTIYVSDDAVTEKFHQDGPDKECFKGGRCGILSNRAFVLPDGKVSVCEQLYWHPNYILGDLTKQSFTEIWNTPKAKSLFKMSRSMFRNSSRCSKCNVLDMCIEKRRRCPVKVLKAYGNENWDYPDPRCVYAPKIQTNLLYK